MLEAAILAARRPRGVRSGRVVVGSFGETVRRGPLRRPFVCLTPNRRCGWHHPTHVPGSQARQRPFDDAMPDVAELLLECAAMQGKRRAGTLSAAEHDRQMEVLGDLMAVGVVVSTRVKVRPAGPPPRGCIRGSDGIIRSTRPGGIGAQYRRHVDHLERRPLRRPARRQTRAARRVVRGRGRSAHGPPREPDEPSDLASSGDTR
jgi:hypothetical protein